jgi:predicted 3-demethylubiquinone-9 3-methyltransferase (glyoxalase superfamily)
MTVEFELEGQKFVGLNGGAKYKFTEAISFIIHCETQDELDYYWDKLSEGGDEKAQVCGWLKDQFGVSWQVIPTTLNDMMSDEDPNKSERVMKALLKMKTKIDMEALKQAYEG